MRADSFGMFWEDKPVERGKREMAPRAMPEIPDTGWHPPGEFPRLDGASVIALDLETKDPHLITKGAGNIRGDSHIAGLAIGTDDGHRWYFPMRHEVGGGNMDPDQVLRWANEELGREHQPKIGANLRYDLGGLKAEGVIVKGPLIDVLIAEPLLDENAHSYALGTLGTKYLAEGKSEEELYEWCSRAYGGANTRRGQGGNIHRAPPSLVGPYAEGDVDLPLRIWACQRPLLEQQGLMDLFQMESKLLPMYMRMRERGVRIDMDRVEHVRNMLLSKRDEAIARIKHLSGVGVDIWAAESVSRAFDVCGVEYPRTPKTDKPSFTAPWLEHHPAEIAGLLRIARQMDKAVGTFIDGYILEHTVNGRIHAEIHPLKSDDGGTVSGRFSYSNPNLQNIPARDPFLGPLLRSMFVPDEGHSRWVKADYSQIEYRFLAHYALGPGADEIRNQYMNDPATDYHETTGKLIEKVTGLHLDRKPTKNVNFGMIYGMAEPTLQAQLGLSDAQSKDFFEAYHCGVPFVKTTVNRITEAASTRGYIRTILGRYARFPFWEPTNWKLSKQITYSRNKQHILDQIEAAQAQARKEKLKVPRGGIKRARTHKSTNSLMQGGAADMMKKAMLDIWESGVCDVIDVPLVTVHDELDNSDPGTPEAAEAFAETKRLMENAIPLKVPVLVDVEYGPDWGHVK